MSSWRKSRAIADGFSAFGHHDPVTAVLFSSLTKMLKAQRAALGPQRFWQRRAFDFAAGWRDQGAHPLQVSGHGHQAPLDLDRSSQQEPAQAHYRFDDAEDRFRGLLVQAAKPLAFGPAQAASHGLDQGEINRGAGVLAAKRLPGNG